MSIWGYVSGIIDNQKDLIDRLYKRTWFPKIVTLVGGQEDESPSGSSATIAADTTNFKIGTQGWQMQMAGAVTGQFILDPVAVNSEDPALFPPASAIGAWFFVEDQTKLTSLTIALFSNAGLSVSYTISWTVASGDLVTGWNFCRAPAIASTLTDWGTIYRVRILAVTSDATNVTIGHVWVECHDKAQLMLINDGGYNGFYTTGYPAIKALKIPVTFAIDPDLLGTGASPDDRLTEAQVATLAAENYNDISFHGFDGSATTAMTEAQIRADTMKAIKWLQRRGYYSDRIWRAAWVGNAATNHAAAQTLVGAYATPSSSSNLSCWPPVNRWNIPRIGLHGLNTAQMDAYFTNLELTKCLMVCYVHSIDAGGGNNITPANWAYFLAKVQAAVAAGWLEGVTFKSLTHGVDISATRDIVFNQYTATGLP